MQAEANGVATKAASVNVCCRALRRMKGSLRHTLPTNRIVNCSENRSGRGLELTRLPRRAKAVIAVCYLFAF